MWFVTHFYLHTNGICAEASGGAAAVEEDIATAIQEIANNERAEREAAVLKLRGSAPSCAIVQWPGRWSGNRQRIILVHNTARVQSDTVSCVLVGKVQEGCQRPCACFEHPSSQARGSCVEKQKIIQLWAIEDAMSEACADGGASGGISPGVQAADDGPDTGVSDAVVLWCGPRLALRTQCPVCSVGCIDSSAV